MFHKRTKRSQLNSLQKLSEGFYRSAEKSKQPLSVQRGALHMEY